LLDVTAMIVRARLNRGDGGLHRRWRPGRGAHVVMRREPSSGTAVHAEVARVHEGGPPQDQALYTCQCGYIFEAVVSTSVDCPHCGSAQAW
jgi:hypothetical protein